MNEEQRALLVGVNLNHHPYFEYGMEELANLAAACDVTVVGQASQNLQQINKTHYIGKGKIEEVGQLVAEKEASVVIFNDELSPSQIRNLEESLECKVIDRTMLILDIFSERAKTREAQLQVEIASLQYALPRLIGLRQSLGRQVGGVGTKNRGVGEKKLELDRRAIEERITLLRRELKELTEHRKTQRKQRQRTEIPTVALVGYTNAGKSTLMNALVETYGETADKQVLEKDMLFATLETAVRKIRLPENQTFLLTDTVGFVSKLPHHLVKAFRSTLEEVKEADLLIHVVDYANQDYMEQIRVTNETLEAIGVTDQPMIYAYNKMDQVTETAGRNGADKPDVIFLSAKLREGIEPLVASIREHCFGDDITCTFLFPYQQGRLVTYFNETAGVLATDHEAEGIRMTVRCRRRDADKYRQYQVSDNAPSEEM
ncbi:GTPase HflX [Anoxynatronum buryatiense]|uniref:GTPase HflX n=1 Tax=Anoxynatronum buryatiense TaxID=489973 RepID=A0AA45WXB8_9CLOT|nr:GTPase HflX [Anoxynatronum buryatiense]SMP62900.1 GTP-binding protein HflX [Anoxynatronum buryatiense]